MPIYLLTLAYSACRRKSWWSYPTTFYSVQTSCKTQFTGTAVLNNSHFIIDISIIRFIVLYKLFTTVYNNRVYDLYNRYHFNTVRREIYNSFLKKKNKKKLQIDNVTVFVWLFMIIHFIWKLSIIITTLNHGIWLIYTDVRPLH